MRSARAATAQARKAVETSYGLLVAAESLHQSSTRQVAHAIFDVGELTATHGLTLCGLCAGEEAALLPELCWTDVTDMFRCPACVAAKEAAPRLV